MSKYPCERCTVKLVHQMYAYTSAHKSTGGIPSEAIKVLFDRRLHSYQFKFFSVARGHS